MAKFFKPKTVKRQHHKRTCKSVFIDKQDHHGNGIVLSTSPITVVEDAIAGECVHMEEYKRSKKVRHARVTTVNDPSPHRTLPFCEYYTSCGGCSMQHTSTSHGFYLKFKALDEYLQRNLHLSALPWQSPILSNIEYEKVNATDHLSQLLQDAIGAGIENRNGRSCETEYRRRVRLAVDARQRNNVKIGFRKRNSSDVIDIKHCPIACESINQFIKIIHSKLKDIQVSRSIGHIVITEGSEKTLAAFYLVKPPSTSVTNCLLELAEHDDHRCVIIEDNEILACSERDKSKLKKYFSSENNVAMQGNDVQLFVEASKRVNAIALQDAPNIKTHIKSHHFLQVNKYVNRQMLSLARTWLSPEIDNVLYDFYCGSGNFALYLAPFVKQVFAFEGVSEMVSQGRENAELLCVNNCDFVCQDLSNHNSLAELELPDNALVILDPARNGASELCQFLMNSKVGKVLYVSCNASSFCRDISFLLPSFTLNKIACLDMFPFTEHIEVVALLCRR